MTLSKWATVLITSLLVTFKGLAAESFQELGATTLSAQYTTLMNDLSTWSYKSEWAITKKLRKDIGNTKLLMDLYTPIYPKKFPGEGERDFFLSVRDLLDEGYEVLGNYKDLYDNARLDGEEDLAIIESRISKKEKKKLGKLAEKWVKDFQKKQEKDNVDEYLSLNFISNLKELSFEERESKDLPKYIWRRIQVTPSKDLTGIENIKVIVAELAHEATADLEELLSIDDITPHENEETFHDWRKTVRMILKINSFYEDQMGLLAASTSSDLTILDGFVDRFGDLNDQFIQLHKYIEEGDEDSGKARKLKNSINERWTELKATLNESSVYASFENIIFELRSGILF